MKRLAWLHHERMRKLIEQMTPEQREELQRRRMFELIRRCGALYPILPRDKTISFVF